MRAVVAGAGDLGPFWAREVILNPDTELVGWADLDVARARAAAKAAGLNGLATGADVAALVREVEADFVVNVTAPTAHHAVTLAALESGAAVLSEKPMATSLVEAREMIAAADRAERLFVVSQNRRYMPELETYRRQVRGLGPLASLTCEFFRHHREPRAAFLLTFPQPLLLDMAIHLFDGARAITGADPLSVFCTSFDPPWTWFAGPAAATAVFEMSDGSRFTFIGNWAAPTDETSWTGRWHALGEEGVATWDGEDTAFQTRDPERFLGLEESLADFVDALRTGRPHASDAHSNLLSLAMCHAAVESAERGAPVRIADVMG